MFKKVWNYMCARSSFIPPFEQIIMWIAIGLGAYHTGLLALYARNRMDFLTIINVFSVLLYSLCVVAARHHMKPLYLLRIFYAEIIVQVLVVGAMLGAGFGFEFYLVAITCHAFYVGYVYRDDSKINAMHYVLIDSLAFLVFRAWTFHFPAVYSFEDPAVICILHTINYFSAILVIVLSMSTLLIQIRHLEAGLLQKNQDLEVLSHTDALTGLVNRRGIEESYDYVMEHSMAYAVILGDIDDFKKINDTYGHNTGDLVLQRVAEIFKGAVRGNDIVCRWGGEEILVFLPLGKKTGAELTANRILERIRANRIESTEGVEFSFTMTFGIADSEEGADLWNVIQQADNRLYRGKGQGKNCLVGD